MAQKVERPMLISGHFFVFMKPSNIVKHVYNTPSVSSLFSTKQWFGRKYAILSQSCNTLINSQLQEYSYFRCFPASSLRRKGIVFTPQLHCMYAVIVSQVRRIEHAITPYKQLTRGGCTPRNSRATPWHQLSLIF